MAEAKAPQAGTKGFTYDRTRALKQAADELSKAVRRNDDEETARLVRRIRFISAQIESNERERIGHLGVF